MFGCMEEEGRKEKKKKISLVWLKWKWENKKRGMEKVFVNLPFFLITKLL